MPSRADHRETPDPAATHRSMLEAACRVGALAALIAGAWLSWTAHRDTPRTAGSRVMRLADSSLAPVVREVRRAASSPDTLVMPLPTVPRAAIRAALGVMAHAGIPVRWVDSTGAAGLALSITHDAAPGAGFDIRVSVPVPSPGASSTLSLRDAGGLLDSLSTDVRASAHSPQLQAWRVAALTAPVRASSGNAEALDTVAAAAPPKRLLIVALPGWESKFTIAALEELGWPVDGTLRTSPTGAVTVGAPQRLDTARYAAVVILDSMTVDAPALLRFVRQGGGLVLSGDALRIPELAAHGPARAFMVRNATAGALLTPTPRRGLEAWELGVPLEAEVLLRDAGSHGHDEVIVAGRRIGAGRVVASGYRQLWRWRMEGTDDGIDEHRRWWSGLIALVLPDGPSVRTPHAVWPGDVAPYADLVAMAGQPLTALPARVSTSDTSRGFRLPVPAVLFGLAALCLLGEWASRRLRGLR